MRLIRCHVENFGILSDFNYEFLPGLNTINQENGWGKSTFSTFLKVMFFGFENEKKKNAQERERARYMPWQGGAYGGWLIFETKGKQYRMERFFGEREREDSFVLYEEKTGLFSHDFSKDIGRELFQLDEPSFKRSIFLSQKDCETGTTDSIHAKLGNLSEQVHDLEGFSAAQNRLMKEINRLTPHRKTGELYKIAEKMEFCQWRLRAQEKREEDLNICNQCYEEKKQKKAELVEQIRQMQEKMLLAGEEREKDAKLAHYKQICEQCREKEEQLEEIEAYFTNGIPEVGEVRKILSLIEKENEADIVMKSFALTEEEETILTWVDEKWTAIPTMEEVAECEARLEEQKDGKEEIDEDEDEEEDGTFLLDFFGDRLKQLPKIMLLGFSLVLIGLPLCYVNIFVGFFVLVAGIFLLYHGKTTGKEADQEEDKEEENKEEEDNEKAKEEAGGQEEVTEEKEPENRDPFLVAYPVENVTDGKEQLEYIKLILVQLNGILQRDQKKRQAKEWAGECANSIEQFYEKYKIQKDTDKKQQLQEMLGRLDKYHMFLDEFSKILTIKEEFEQNNEIAKWMEVDAENEDTSLLNQQLEILQKQLEEVTDSMYADLKKMESLQQQLDEDAENKRQLEKLEQEAVNKEKQFRVMEQTTYYLQKAKESFMSRYRSPLEEGFNRYSRYLTKEALEFHIDTNMELKLQQEGALRDMGSFSVGWQDLFGICMRLSLADAMYPGEKPFLILDDPFVNLDAEKIRGGLWLLNQIQEEYQILYFTCHESRTPGAFFTP